MDRVRLTKRIASVNRKADSATPETAIDLGKNRKYHKIDEYHTFKQQVNHELPDMRHEWKDNPREETGHGIPKMAKVYIAAKKATRLAMMFLGESATEEAVEKQARAFMRMGDKALTASINRWAECNEEGCDKKGCDEAKVEAPKAEVAAEEAPAQEPAPVAEQPKAEACKTADEEAPAEETVEAPAEAPATEGEDEGTVEVDDELIDTTVEFDEPAETDVESDAELEACFNAADEGKEDAPVSEPVARKAGVKRLAGQPTLVRVASKKADELAGLWDKWENPDIR